MKGSSVEEIAEANSVSLLRRRRLLIVDDGDGHDCNFLLSAHSLTHSYTDNDDAFPPSPLTVYI